MDQQENLPAAKPQKEPHLYGPSIPLIQGEIYDDR